MPPIGTPFETLFAHNPVPMWVFDPETRVVLDVNEAAESLYGYSREECLRLSLDEIRPAEDRPGFGAQLAEYCRAERSTTDPARHLTKDGTVLDVRIVSYTVEHRGRPARLAMVLDAKEQVRAEQELARAETTLRRIIEHSPNLFYAHTPEHVLTYVSPQSRHFLGCSPDEASRRWTEFITEHPANQLGVRHTERAIATGEPQSPYELELETADGRHIWAQVNEGPVVVDGRTVAMVGTLTDITARKVAGERLALSDTILSNLGDIVLVADAGAVITYASPSVRRVLGYEPAEMLGDGWWNVAYPDPAVRAEERRTAAAAARGRTTPPPPYLRQVRHRGGTVRWIRWQESTGPDGTVIGVGHDVTERKLAEDALRDSEERLRRVMEQAGDAFFVYDETGRLVLTNEAACRLLGYPREELLHRNVADFIADAARDDVIGPRLRALGAGETMVTEQQLRCGNERLVPVEARIGWLDLDGRRLVLAITRDVTDRKRAEAALRESEERFRTLMEHAGDAFVLHDQHGVVYAVNRETCRCLGYAEEELIGMSITQFVEGVDPTHVVGHRLEQLAPGEVLQLEGVHRRKDGSRFPVEVRVAWLTVGGQRMILAITRDITERRAVEAQLRQAQKMEAVGQLTGGIAHDFNNILTVVLAQSDLVAAALDDQPELKADVVEVQRAARRGAEMIRKLLTFSRNDQLEFRATDLRHLVHDAGRMLRRLLPETIQIQIDDAEPAPAVRADHAAVQQILMNVATNARDAMPGGGTVTVTIGRRRFTEEERHVRGWGEAGEYAMITVRDTGCGMDERTKAKVFEPFFTTKPTGRGTGLGMAMIYGLMKQHGGYVDIETAPGEGTAVHLFIPAAADVAEVDGSAEPDSETLPGGSETILLVEDEEELARAATRILRSLGYFVIRASNGEEAVRILQEADVRIDLVMTDVVMPRLGGRGVHRWIRERRLTTRVLFTSGYALPEIGEAEGLDASVPFIGKPWTLSELAGAVRQVLDEAVAA